MTWGEQGPVNYPSKVHMNSHRVQQQAQGQHESACPLSLYHGIQFCVFYGTSKYINECVSDFSAFAWGTFHFVNLPCPALM